MKKLNSQEIVSALNLLRSKDSESQDLGYSILKAIIPDLKSWDEFYEGCLSRITYFDNKYIVRRLISSEPNTYEDYVRYVLRTIYNIWIYWNPYKHKYFLFEN